MRFLRRRWFVALSVLLALGIPGAWLLARDTSGSGGEVTAIVKRGDFAVTVTTSGELRARKFVQIQGPSNLQEAEVYQVKIASIVPEGTVVKEGDVVAELDRSALAAKMAEGSLALQKAQAVYEQATLDSTLTLSKAREEMRNMELVLEERRLAMEQAAFEAPTVKRQAEIENEKATRALAQAKLNYVTQTEQSRAKMREVGADLNRQKNKLGVLQGVMDGFTIRAPAAGMVIYIKEWSGKKKTAGSQVNAWEPSVATLPDLTQMESITYVNEIDVRRIAAGHPVVLSLDADPTKKLSGKVVTVANVGEQRPNSDAKVFEVKVTVEQPDTTLRPGMTTSNAVRTLAVRNVLFIPLEAIISEDGVPYVYKRSRSGVIKQEVETGAMNDDQAVITRGLDAGDRVLLSSPADGATLQAVRLPGSSNRPRSKGNDSGAPARQVPVRPDTATNGTKAASPSSGSPAAVTKVERSAPARP